MKLTTRPIAPKPIYHLLERYADQPLLNGESLTGHSESIPSKTHKDYLNCNYDDNDKAKDRIGKDPSKDIELIVGISTS